MRFKEQVSAILFAVGEEHQREARQKETKLVTMNY